MKEFNQTYNDAFNAVSDLKRATSHDYKLFNARHYRALFQRAAVFFSRKETRGINAVQIVYMVSGVVLLYYANEFSRNVGGDIRAIATIAKNDNGGVKMRLRIAD